jgi:phosphatidylglycerophosphate synthase
LKDIQNHRRVNDILLGPLERPALRWLAEHSPAWVTPDTLTAVGVLGTLMTAAGYLLTLLHPAFLWLASLGFVVNWYGDSLDGTLARFRHIERPKFGFFIDHTVDAFSEIAIVLSLGISHLVRFDLASIALIGYLLMSILVLILTAVTGEFRISYGKLGPTEVRLILILVNTLAFFTGNPTLPISGINITLFDVFVIIIAFILYFFAIQTAVKHTLSLHKLGK